VTCVLPEDLGEIVTRTYSPKVFRAPEVTPLVVLDEEKQLCSLGLFHGRWVWHIEKSL